MKYKVCYFDLSEDLRKKYLNFDSDIYDKEEDAVEHLNSIKDYVSFAFVISFDDYSFGTYEIVYTAI